MGGYIYRLAAPAAIIEAALGEAEVALARLRYAYKPTRVGQGTNERWYRQYVVLPCAAWSGRQLPAYAVPVFSIDPNKLGEPEDGAPVLRWSPGQLAVNDDPDWDGRQIGVLRLTTDSGGVVRYRVELLPARADA